MRFLSWVFVIFVMTLQLDSVFGYVAEDQILSLPGWSGKTLPSRQFSGYLNAAMGDKHLHYWFVESETDPVNAPVVVWYNGGPGCSSLDGFFYEHGPWVLSDDGKTLSVREYRWSRLANMLYIEAPAGVGFSYSDSKSYQHTDESSAFDNRDAIENFFEKFPEYKKNPFYISGESYAGIYVPMLARAILMAEDAGTYTGAKLLGIGVGNGCTGTEVGVCGFYNSNLCRGLYLQMEYILNLAFTNPDLKVAVAQACEWDKCIEPTAKINVLSNQCMKLLDEVSFELGDINTYNVYGKCSFNSCDGPSGNAVVTRVGPAKQMKQQRRLSTYDPNFDATNQVTKQKSSKISHLHSSSVVDTTDDDENFEKFFDYGPAGCIDSYAATTYLTNPEVQKAIHVHALDYCWAVCNQAKGFRYSSTQSNLPRDVYPTLISRLRVLIFNGDWDACVPYTDNQLWTESMGFDTIKPWHPWAYTDDKNTTQIGGYSVKYNVSSLGLGSFEFRTIRGAGHMVPTDAPLQGLVVLGHLIGHQFDTEDVLYQSLYYSSNNTSDVASLESAAAYRERTVLIFSTVIIGTLLLGVIAFLSYQLQKMQNHVRQSEIGMVQFNPIGSASDDHKVNMPYSSVRAQDEEDVRH